MPVPESEDLILPAFFSIISALICGLSGILLVFQGRGSILPGKLAIAASFAAFSWFLITLARNPVFRARPGLFLTLTLAAVLATYGLALLALFSLQDKLLFIPVFGRFAQCDDLKTLGFEATDAVVGTERVRAYVHRDARAKAWMFIFHGNAESACDGFAYVQSLSGLPLNFALVEYPGYQDDPTSPSQARLIGNATAAYDLLLGKPAELPVFLMGRSLGTGVATYLASVRAVHALVLISPYTSIADVAAYQYPFLPVRWLLRNPFPAADWARNVAIPTLIIHGTEDRTIPLSMAKEQSLSFGRPPELTAIAGANHNDVLADPGGPAWRRIREFVSGQLRP